MLICACSLHEIHISMRTLTVLQTLKVHIILRMMMNVISQLGFVLFTVPTYIANTEYIYFHIKNTTNNNFTNMQIMYFSFDIHLHRDPRCMCLLK